MAVRTNERIAKNYDKCIEILRTVNYRVFKDLNETMKHRISISIDEELIPQMRELMRKQRIFRNKSHLVEFAIQELLRKEENE